MSSGVYDWTQASGLFNVGKTRNFNQEIAVVKTANSTNLNPAGSPH